MCCVHWPPLKSDKREISESCFWSRFIRAQDDALQLLLRLGVLSFHGKQLSGNFTEQLVRLCHIVMWRIATGCCNSRGLSLWIIQQMKACDTAKGVRCLRQCLSSTVATLRTRCRDVEAFPGHTCTWQSWLYEPRVLDMKKGCSF